MISRARASMRRVSISKIKASKEKRARGLNHEDIALSDVLLNVDLTSC